MIVCPLVEIPFLKGGEEVNLDNPHHPQYTKNMTGTTPTQPPSIATQRPQEETMLTEHANTIMWGSPDLNGLDSICKYGATHVIRADQINAMNIVQRGWDQPLRKVAAAILVDVFSEDTARLAPYFPNTNIITIIEQGRKLAQHTPLRTVATTAD